MLFLVGSGYIVLSKWEGLNTYNSFSIVEGYLFIDEGIIFNKNINNNIIFYTFLSLIFSKIQHLCKMDILLIFHHALKGKNF